MSGSAAGSPADRDHARALLAMARKDLRALAGMENPETFADEIVGFHAQQAIEKALKAWLAALGKEYPLTHEIDRLLALLDDEGCDVTPFRTLDRYTSFAVAFRYEALGGEASGLDRAEAVRDARAVFERVQAFLSA